MDVKNFVLSYYNSSTEGFHIQKVENAYEAKKPHTHEYFQIYYIAKGSLTHFVENNSSDLFQGDMFIIPPGAVHYILPKREAIFYSFSFMPEFLEGVNQSGRLISLFLHSLTIEKNPLPKVSVKPEDVFYIEATMEKMLGEFNAKEFGYREIVQACSILLITSLARNYFEKNETAHNIDNGRQLVLGCVEYIKNNFTLKISLDEISKLSAMSKNSFCKLFYELTGYSFNGYLNLCRVKKATKYIKDGYNITSIYGLCGYSDFSTFYRNFKKITGFSPREYKKNH